MTTTTTKDDEVDDATLDHYLTLVPKGLEDVAVEALCSSLRERSYSCNVEILWRDDDDGASLLKRLRDKRRRREERRVRVGQGNGGTSTKKDFVSDFLANNVGTVSRSDDDDRETRVGYRRRRDDDVVEVVAADPGLVEGVRALTFRTNAPPIVVASVRVVGGALSALVRRVDDPTAFPPDGPLEEAVRRTREIASSPGYAADFERALRLWASHALGAWPRRPDVAWSAGAEAALRERARGRAPLSFRASCARSRSKAYSYARDDLSPALGAAVPVSRLRGRSLWKDDDDDDEDDDTVATNDAAPYRVDLRDYDFEFFALILEGGRAVFGVSLLPHRHLGSKSFAAGKIPPDVSPPYVKHDDGVDDDDAPLVTLRPSTAALLLHLADPSPGDVVVDPCAGVGTIPFEAARGAKGLFALGGELALDAPRLRDAAVARRRVNVRVERTDEDGGGGGGGGASDALLRWDATSAPLRDASVDLVVSDLPFGQRCSSANLLAALLPSILAEVGRITRPRDGRAVLLCGDARRLVEAAAEVNRDRDDEDDVVFRLPPRDALPVNVGGHVAWAVTLERGGGTVDGADRRRRDAVRRWTARRERNERQRAAERRRRTTEGARERRSSKARRVQA